jgi:hypothetical protein
MYTPRHAKRLRRNLGDQPCRRLIPVEAKLDAFHVASAAVANVDYLVTQNFTHIANAKTIPAIYAALERLGFGRLLICTPAEFLGGLDNGPK